MFKVGDIIRNKNTHAYRLEVVRVLSPGVDYKAKCLSIGGVYGVVVGQEYTIFDSYFEKDVSVPVFKIGDKLRGRMDGPRAGWIATCIVAPYQDISGKEVMDVDGRPATDKVLTGFRFLTSCLYWELDADNQSSSGPSVSNQAQVINNHTCPMCKNTRCNKQEKSCWRCGSKL